MNSQPIFGRNSNLFNYSTVAEWLKREVTLNSIIMEITVVVKSANLTKTSHYTDYQQKLYNEVKRLKEVESYGYRRISYILYEKGFRSIRTDSILKNNYIYSIYKKGKERENRMIREFKTTIENINVYQNLKNTNLYS